MNRQGLHDGSVRFAWAVISISVYSGFLRTSNQRRGIADHASFLCIWKRNNINIFIIRLNYVLSVLWNSHKRKFEFGDIYINEASTFCTAPIRMAKQHAILMSVRAPVGAVNIATQDCCIGRGLASITPKVGKSITMFVFYALKYMEDEIERLGTGSTFKAINKDSYAKIQMPDVDIEKQIEFVKIAEQADKSEFNRYGITNPKIVAETLARG